ncbi:hypothetical protein T05_7992 [Trichinella murrelli]|uniref:Uncharacterized protein n=1 Tax=Trichinella murrelli TaxID=144512 RepID=A0A0V0T0G3_9BILA|nr:hypothetical protein T05_7992 [Trichinella murrelli]
MGAFVYLTDVAIGSLMRNVQRMEQRKCENTDGTKQNKRRQEVNAISCGSVKQG